MIEMLIKKLSSSRAFRSCTPATQDQICCAEQKLNLVFADEYKKYLAVIGCASVYGHEFTGICNVRRLNVVIVTEEQRKLQENFPPDLYVLEETNIDGIVICQDANGCVYSKTPNCSPCKIYDSFVEYLESDANL